MQGYRGFKSQTVNEDIVFRGNSGIHANGPLLLVLAIKSAY